MAHIGYGRVSTKDQTADGQADRLAAAGCEADHIYIDYASGKVAQRPAWEKCRNYLREGDTLVITRLDRLGRSVKNLIEISELLDKTAVNLLVLDQGINTATPVGRFFFNVLASIAEFEHALIVERTLEGLAAARARGRNGGSKPKLSARQVERARELYDLKGPDGKRAHTVAEIGSVFGVSRQTIYRALDGQG